MSIESVMIFNHLICFQFAFNLFQHQGLFQWVSSLYHVTKVLDSASVLPMNIQGWFPLGLTGLIPLQSKWFSGVFSSTIIWKHQFFSAQPSFIYPIYISVKYNHPPSTSIQSIYSFNLSIYPCIPTIHPASIHPSTHLSNPFLSIVHLSIKYLFITHLYSDFLQNYELHPEKAPTCVVYSCRLIVTGSGQALAKYVQCGPVNERMSMLLLSTG